jgi:hypothetical protein
VFCFRIKLPARYKKRQAALQQIRLETETALKQALGEQAFLNYQRSGGWWINNLAPTQSRNVRVVPAVPRTQ